MPKAFHIREIWKNHNRFKRTSFILLINLAVADLLARFTEPIVLGPYLPRPLKQSSFNTDYNGEIFTTFQTSFPFGSVFFLEIILQEHVYVTIAIYLVINLTIQRSFSLRGPAVDTSYNQHKEAQLNRKTLQDSVYCDNCISSLLDSLSSQLLHSLSLFQVCSTAFALYH